MSPTSPSRPLALIAVDLDGTLLDREGRPHPHDVRALQAAAERGIAVSIVTGRLYSGTRDAAEAVGIRGPIACAEGSHLIRASDHATLQHHGLPIGGARALQAALARHRPEAAFLFADDAIVHDPAGLPHVDYVRTWSRVVRSAPAVVEHALWSEREAITGVVAIGTEAQLRGVEAELAAASSDPLQVAVFPLWRPLGSWGMFVRAAGVTKGSALAVIAQHHGLTPEQCLTVGDWTNDVSMFRVSGRSYAMAQAPEEVRRAASHTLSQSSAEGGGIAFAIDDAFGIRP